MKVNEEASMRSWFPIHFYSLTIVNRGLGVNVWYKAVGDGDHVVVNEVRFDIALDKAFEWCVATRGRVLVLSPSVADV